MKPRILDFIGVGAARCGTTWLVSCLRRHPDVFIPEQKELHLFDREPFGEAELAMLQRVLSGASDKALAGEYTPRYLITPAAIERIQAHHPEIRVIVMLRDPVERSFSQYVWFRFNLKKEPHDTFEAAFSDPWFRDDYLVKSLYADQIEHLLSVFPREQVLLLRFERIRSEPETVVREALAHIGADPAYAAACVGPTVNASRAAHRAPPALWARFVRRSLRQRADLPGPLRDLVAPVTRHGSQFVDRLPLLSDRAPVLSPETRRSLYQNYFREDIEKLERIWGEDLTLWKHDVPPEQNATSVEEHPR